MAHEYNKKDYKNKIHIINIPDIIKNYIVTDILLNYDINCNSGDLLSFDISVYDKNNIKIGNNLEVSAIVNRCEYYIYELNYIKSIVVSLDTDSILDIYNIIRTNDVMQCKEIDLD